MRLVDFHGKVLAEIAGKPMIQRVYEQAKKSIMLDDLFLAIDDQRVLKCVEGFGGKAIMTNTGHESGTDRIAEATHKIAADIIVNIQGAQPIFDAVMIDEMVAPLLEDTSLQMSTLKTEIAQLNPGDIILPVFVLKVPSTNLSPILDFKSICIFTDIQWSRPIDKS